jgi:endonuclease-3
VSPKKVNQIYHILAAGTPTPTTELRYSSPFELLIAVILSAQATDISVNRATAQLYRVANTASGIRKIGLRKLKVYIRTIGLYNTKATNIIRTCRILEDKYGGKVPSTRHELETLPGVGRKTASVVLNTAFGQPTIAVDTHIFRVSNRTGLASGKTVLQVEKKLLEITPTFYRRDAHHLLILHGRYTCTARNPHCSDCRIQKLCEFSEKHNA